MLKTVCRNLISNAIKFTKIGGKVSIEIVQKTEHVQIIILDNGIGMNEEAIKNIFDKFNSSKGTNNEKGLGLGLFLCKSIVNKLRGTLSCESKKGTGSSFVITLPYA